MNIHLLLAGMSLVLLAVTPPSRGDRDLDRAIAEPDALERARAIEPFVDPADPVRHEKALAALADCGPAALEVLRPLLVEETRFGESPSLLKTLVKAGGDKAVPILEHLLRDEKTYWNNLGMNLEDPDKIPAARIDRILAILDQLTALSYRDHARLVGDLRDQFRDHPVLGTCGPVIEAAGAILSRR
jgi:hypothetical protein